MSPHPIEIKRATSPRDFSHAKDLIMEYVSWLNMDLSFQNFDHEMAMLPDMYNEQEGGLFIAYLDKQPVGVAGLRKFNQDESEVKRMYVKPDGRGMSIGKLLLNQCIQTAKDLKYKSIKLDTGDFMKAAIHLYLSQGFVEIPAYRFNPHEGAKYFELKLGE